MKSPFSDDNHSLGRLQPMSPSTFQILLTFLLPMLWLSLIDVPCTSAEVLPSKLEVHSSSHPVIQDLETELTTKLPTTSLDEITVAQTNRSALTGEFEHKTGKVIHTHLTHSSTLPIHSRIISGDWSFLSDDGFYGRLVVVASLAALVVMILILLSTYGPKRRFKGYQVTSLNEKDFLSIDDDDDDEVSLFDAGNHKLLSKSKHIV